VQCRVENIREKTEVPPNKPLEILWKTLTRFQNCKSQFD